MYGYDLSFFVKRVSVGFTTSFCPAPGAPYQTRNASPLAAVLEHLGQAYAAAAHSIVMLPFDRSFGSRSIFARPRPARFAFLDHERMIVADWCLRGGFSCPNKPTTLHAGCPALTGLGAVTPAPYGRACPSHPAARAPTTAPIAPPQAPADKRLDGLVSHVLLAMLPMSGGGSRPRSTRRPYTPLYNPLRPAGVADEAYWRPFHSDFTEKLRSYP